MDNSEKNTRGEYPYNKIIFPSSESGYPPFSQKKLILIFCALLCAAILVFIGFYSRTERSEIKEQARIREELQKGRVPENAPLLGQVISLARDSFVLRARTAGGGERDIQISLQSDTQFYLHLRNSSQKETDRSRLRVGQFLIVESLNPVGEGRTAAARSVSIIE